jgi:hypothetical protein
VTASFAGAPVVPFTVFGAAPTRDAAVIGFSVSTAVAEAGRPASPRRCWWWPAGRPRRRCARAWRYDGEIATGTDNHALNIGVRMSW